MTGLLWLLEAVLLGCLAVHRFSRLGKVQPAWARWLLIFAAGAAGGIGVTSGLFFVCADVMGFPLAAMVLELAALAWLAFLLFRRPADPAETAKAQRGALVIPLTAALLVAIVTATAGIAAAWDANPHGNWDGWAIWNLRARFLDSGGALAARAWSPALDPAMHAEYPLLVPAFVARCWWFAGAFSPVVPAATSYAFLLALLALAAGGVAVLRGPLLGILSALTLAAMPALLREVPSQYADVPLACYIFGALVLTLLDRAVLAGVLAGLAAWTKNEGLLFLVLFLSAIAIFRRRAAVAAVAGALPVALLVACFKLLLARGSASQLASSSPARLFDFSRYGTILAAFGREFAGLGAGWYHPILPLAALAVALRFDRQGRREAAFCGITVAALLAGYGAVYLVTPYDLAWQLQTSLGRLLVQVWPALILTGFLALRRPEAAAIVTVEKPPKARRKAQR